MTPLVDAQTLGEPRTAQDLIEFRPDNEETNAQTPPMDDTPLGESTSPSIRNPETPVN